MTAMLVMLALLRRLTVKHTAPSCYAEMLRTDCFVTQDLPRARLSNTGQCVSTASVFQHFYKARELTLMTTISVGGLVNMRELSRTRYTVMLCLKFGSRHASDWLTQHVHAAHTHRPDSSCCCLAAADCCCWAARRLASPCNCSLV